MSSRRLEKAVERAAKLESAAEQVAAELEAKYPGFYRVRVMAGSIRIDKARKPRRSE